MPGCCDMFSRELLPRSDRACYCCLGWWSAFPLCCQLGALCRFGSDANDSKNERSHLLRDSEVNLTKQTVLTQASVTVLEQCL